MMHQPVKKDLEYVATYIHNVNNTQIARLCEIITSSGSYKKKADFLSILAAKNKIAMQNMKELLECVGVTCSGESYAASL